MRRCECMRKDALQSCRAPHIVLAQPLSLTRGCLPRGHSLNMIPFKRRPVWLCERANILVPLFDSTHSPRVHPVAHGGEILWSLSHACMSVSQTEEHQIYPHADGVMRFEQNKNCLSSLCNVSYVWTDDIATWLLRSHRI